MLCENLMYVDSVSNYKYCVNEPFKARNEINERTAETLTLCQVKKWRLKDCAGQFKETLFLPLSGMRRRRHLPANC
jgi:hypothetical protein